MFIVFMSSLPKNSLRLFILGIFIDGSISSNGIITNALSSILGWGITNSFSLIHKSSNKRISISLGFLFFYLSFKVIYDNYAKYSDMGMKLFKFLVVVWGLYGIAAMTDIKSKNIAYNLLDIVSKNFYGLFIYYYILHIHGKSDLLGSI